MKTFLNSKKPIITVILSQVDATNIIDEIRRSIEQGADAFCFQLERLKREYRDEDTIKKIFFEMRDKLVYATNYPSDVNEELGLPDGLIAEQLLKMAEYGACLVDVRGDMFSHCSAEITMNNDAICKQKELIDKIHNLGSDVLISSHVKDDEGNFKFLPTEAVVAIAKEQIRRGADIAKIVTNADNIDELKENIFTSAFLNKLNIPGLFLCNGSFCHKHRRIAPLIQGGIFLTREDSYKGQPQPTISEARKILENF